MRLKPTPEISAVSNSGDPTNFHGADRILVMRMKAHVLALSVTSAVSP